MRLAVHVARWEKEERFVRILVGGRGIMNERDNSENLGVDGNTILK